MNFRLGSPFTKRHHLFVFRAWIGLLFRSLDEDFGGTCVRSLRRLARCDGMSHGQTDVNTLAR